MSFSSSHPIRLRALIGACLVLAGAGNAVHAEDGVNYLTGHVGWNALERWPVQVDFGGPRVDGRLGLDKSYHLGLAAGRDTAHWRYEVEYQHGRMKIDSLALGDQAQSVGGSGHYDMLMLNGYRKYQASESVNLFAGLGAGWGRVSFPDSRFTGLGSECACFRAAHDSGFAYQGRLGAELALAPDQSLYVMYTRLHLDGTSAGAMPSTHYDKRWVGAASIGYRYLFR